MFQPPDYQSCLRVTRGGQSVPGCRQAVVQDAQDHQRRPLQREVHQGGGLSEGRQHHRPAGRGLLTVQLVDLCYISPLINKHFLSLLLLKYRV